MNKEMNIRVVVHGDDFTVLGDELSLDWFRREISKRYEVKFRGRIGPNEGDEKSARILNRIVEWTPEGLCMNLTKGMPSSSLKDVS